MLKLCLIKTETCVAIVFVFKPLGFMGNPWQEKARGNFPAPLCEPSIIHFTVNEGWEEVRQDASSTLSMMLIRQRGHRHQPRDEGLLSLLTLMADDSHRDTLVCKSPLLFSDVSLPTQQTHTNKRTPWAVETFQQESAGMMKQADCADTL